MGKNPYFDLSGADISGEGGGCGEEPDGFRRCVDEDGPTGSQDAAEVEDERDKVGAEPSLDYDRGFGAVR